MRLQVPWVFLPLYFSCSEAQVDQSPQSLVTGEGKVSTMSCAFTSKYQTFHWYQQLPGRGLTYLLSVSLQENATQPRFVGQPLEDGKRSSLHITESQLGDSGSYLCAVRDTAGNRLIFGSGTRVSVEPNLPESEPSIYQLKSKDGNFSACLITDFAPGNISVGSSGSEPTPINGSVVQVKNPESGKVEASYGTVLWGKEKSFHCFADHKAGRSNMSDSDEEGDTCRITELDDNFETDEKLNLLSFTLLGLRIVFVKGVALNLLLTIWLWKS